MNEYTYDEIEVGMKESFSVLINEEMVSNFTKYTGDINPMHIDKEYAVSKGYDSKIVYGMLTASFYSTLAGVYLPGKNCLFYQCDTLFNNPVYEGDTLLVSGQVIDKSDATLKKITVKAIIKNQKGKTVSRAKLVLGVME